jgi:hypothetical protein
MLMPEPANKTLLIVVSSDPRTSHRPAEAIRLAAGLAAWRKVDVTLFFTGPAVLAVNPDVDDFVDEESYRRYLPMFLESSRPVLVEAGSAMPSVDDAVIYRTVSQREFAAETSRTTYLMRF